MREAFHLKYVNLLRTPGERTAVGTANTTAQLIDHLGLSRTEAQGRTQASTCLGDVEPEPYPGDRRDEGTEARLADQREDNRVAALTKAETGAVTCDKLHILRLALHDLKRGGCYSAEDVKAIVLDRIDDLSAGEVRLEARALVEVSNESLDPDPFEDLYAADT